MEKVPKSDAHKNCVGFLRRQLQDPRIVHILNEIHNMGCTLPKPFFRCVPCLKTPDEIPKMTAAYVLGSFDKYNDMEPSDDIVNMQIPSIDSAFSNAPNETSSNEAKGEYGNQHLLDLPGVIACEDVMDRYPDRVDYTNSILHEMIHAYDDCRAVIGWHNCDQVACAEIRASALSGECRYNIERQRGIMKGVSGQLQKCVKRRATVSLNINPHCYNQDSAAVVEKVFEKCFADIEPFYIRP